MKQSAWWTAAFGVIAWAAYRYQPQRLCLRRSRSTEAAPGGRVEPAELIRPDARLLIVTAHPDDSEFFLGGTLLRLAEAGAHLHLVVATDGDKGFYPFVRTGPLSKRRRLEQGAAAAEWRAEEVVFLGYPDGRVRCSEALVGRIERELRRIAPEYVILFDYRCPPFIAHRDHLRTGEATGVALQWADIGARALYFATRAPDLFVDVSSCWTSRLALLDCHPSQWHSSRYRQVRSLITRTDRKDGRRSGTPFAEGLRTA